MISVKQIKSSSNLQDEATDKCQIQSIQLEEILQITELHIPTHDQLADIFTKPLDQETFTRLRGELGVCLIS
jgi:hypothetical protein